MIKPVRNAFLSGLILFIPISITLIVIEILLDYLGLALPNVIFAIESVGRPLSLWLFNAIDPNIRESVWIDYSLDIIGLLVLALFIIIVGYIAQWGISRLFMSLVKHLLKPYPLLTEMFYSSRDLIRAFTSTENTKKPQPYILQPTSGAAYQYGISFVKTGGEIAHKTPSDSICLFIPKTPNPTTGHLVFMDKRKLLALNKENGEALKTILSAGIYSDA